MDIDNWVVQNLENALNTWNNNMAEVDTDASERPIPKALNSSWGMDACTIWDLKNRLLDSMNNTQKNTKQYSIIKTKT